MRWNVYPKDKCWELKTGQGGRFHRAVISLRTFLFTKGEVYMELISILSLLVQIVSLGYNIYSKR